MNVVKKDSNQAEKVAAVKLTKAEIIEGFVDPTVVLLGFALSQTGDKEASIDEVIDSIKEELQKLKTKEGEEPTWKDAMNAVIKIADTAAHLTHHQLLTTRLLTLLNRHQNL